MVAASAHGSHAALPDGLLRRAGRFWSKVLSAVGVTMVALAPIYVVLARPDLTSGWTNQKVFTVAAAYLVPVTAFLGAVGQTSTFKKRPQLADTFALATVLVTISAGILGVYLAWHTA